MIPTDPDGVTAVPLPPRASDPRAVRTVADAREQRRRVRLARVAATGVVLNLWLWSRVARGLPLPLPHLPYVDPLYLMTAFFLGVLVLVMAGTSLVAGRSPHVTYTPEQLDVRMADVKGLGPVTEEVRRSLQLFLGARGFRHEMGGRARRGLLFEGPPGTGKTHLAKAMAAEAGVPFLFVSATAFQSMYYGATARKIRSYFRALRKAARAQGGGLAVMEGGDAGAVDLGIRRLVLLHLDGITSDVLPAPHTPVESAEGRAVGFVGTAVRHYELGMVALAVIKQNVADGTVLRVGESTAAVEA